MDSSDGQAGSSEGSSDNFLPEADEIIEASWAASEPGKFLLILSYCTEFNPILLEFIAIKLNA